MADEIEKIAEQFGFSILSSRRINSACLFAKTRNSDGEHADLFFKSHPAEPSLQIAIQHKFSACGFEQIPAYIPTLQSNYFVQLDHNYWTVQNHVQSKPYYDWLNFDCSVEHCALAGKTLASVHLAGRKVWELNPNLIAHSGIQIAASLFETLSVTKAEFDAYHQKVLNVSCAPLLATAELRIASLRIEALEARFSRLLKDISKLEQALPQTINHGDFHDGNLLFSKDGAFVIDWDYACLSSPLYDLSYALLTFSLQPDFSDEHDIFNTRKAEAFLDGYSSASGVDIVAVMNQMQFLDTYSEFIYLLLLQWVMSECLKDDSLYKCHKGFAKLALALTYCCQ